MPFAELLPALEANRIDMILSGMTITPKRNQNVALVGPYYISGKGILAVAEKCAALWLMLHIFLIDRLEKSKASIDHTLSIICPFQGMKII